MADEVNGLAMVYKYPTCKNLLKLRKLSPKFGNGYVIYSGDLTPEIDGIKFLNYKDTARILN